VVVIGIISAAAFAIWLAIWTDVMSREEEDRGLETDHRAERYYQLADTAERLRDELGREPSVREIYAAIDSADPDEGSVHEPDAIETDPVIDLRARVLRIKESQAESSVA
jgi:hypothetical protein